MLENKVIYHKKLDFGIGGGQGFTILKLCKADFTGTCTTSPLHGLRLNDCQHPASSLRFSSVHILPMGPLLGGQRSLGSLSRSARNKDIQEATLSQRGTEVVDKCPSLRPLEGQFSLPTSLCQLPLPHLLA